MLTVISSCSDNNENPNIDIQLLADESGKTWKLTTQKVMNADECLGTCVLKYSKVRFFSNNRGQFSTFTCLMEPCSNGTTVQDGEVFNWSFNGRQLSILGFPFEIISLTENTLQWKTKILGFDFEETYTAVPNEEFLNRTTMLAGTNQKTWKYVKREFNGSPTTLTSCLVNTRFTNYTDGKLVTSYLLDGCGSTTEGFWEFAEGETKYISGRDDGSSITFDLLELTPESLVIGYTNPSNQYVVLYQVPE